MNWQSSRAIEKTYIHKPKNNKFKITFKMFRIIDKLLDNIMIDCTF